jgi:YVTN family beta-propeller protein
LAALTLSALVAACGGSRSDRTSTQAAAPPETVAAGHPAPPPTPPQALVTAETDNRLLVVELPSGRVVSRVVLPRDPEDVAAEPTGAVVTSAAAGSVTLVGRSPLRPVKVLSGFGAPHIVEIAPDGRHAYVTDDARGTLSVIDLRTRRVTSRIAVGAGAHHMSFDLIHAVAWVALGESARTIVVIGTRSFDHPRVIGRFDPGFNVHDLAFSTDGERIWMTSATGSEVTVFDSVKRRPVFRVPAGLPPQHVAFDGP